MFNLCSLTLLHLERPKLYTILAFLSAIGINRSFEISEFEYNGHRAVVHKGLKESFYNTNHLLSVSEKFFSMLMVHSRGQTTPLEQNFYHERQLFLL